MNMKKVLHLLSLFLLLATAGFAQNADKELTVSGVVVDKDGNVQSKFIGFPGNDKLKEEFEKALAK